MGKVIVQAETPEDEALLRRIVALAEGYKQGEQTPRGEHISLLYSGRNRLYLVELEQGAYVLKAFGALGILRRAYYGWWGESKAKRSHLNALELGKRGIPTARSLGYVEHYDALGRLGASYYASAYVRSAVEGVHPSMRGWASPEGLLPELARYLARLHQAGVVHHDLSPGNILYSHQGGLGQYSFCLVDLNRMSFASEPLGLEASARNLCKLASHKGVTQLLAYYYARERGFSLPEFGARITTLTDAFWAQRNVKLSLRWMRRRLGYGRGRALACIALYRLLRAVGGLCPKGGALRQSLFALEQRLYRNNLSAEDIRHVLRHRGGYGYQLPDSYSLP